MKNSVPATKPHQLQDGPNDLVNPEMRRQIRQLECDLDEFAYRLSRHLELFDNIRNGLDTARQTARCLLANDPFEAWEKAKELGEEDWEPFSRASIGKEHDTRRTRKAAPNVKKLITRRMRKQVADAKQLLDEYALCLAQFFEDVTKLKSLDTALELAEALGCEEPVETWRREKGGRKKPVPRKSRGFWI